MDSLWRKTARLLAPFLIAGTVIYLLIAVFLFFSQNSMLYHPRQGLRETPASIGLAFETVEFETTDNVKLVGWYVNAINARGVVLFCHGNAGNMSGRLGSVSRFVSLDLDVFIFDYRGYGNSAGEPHEEGIYRDVDAAWRYLTEVRGVEPDSIVVFGRSLGGAVAAWLAQTRPTGGVILESTFTSVPDMGAERYPFLPVRLLALSDYNTVEAIRQVHRPILVIHSRSDELIPFSHGERLFENANEPKYFLEIHGSHNYGFVASGEVYQNGLQEFLSLCLPKPIEPDSVVTAKTKG